MPELKRRSCLPGLILGVALLSVLSARSLPAQSSNELNFASSLEDYRNLRRMLPDHVHRLAKDLLELRARKIASFARPEDIAARRAYVRERMTRGLGGFPERTPLDARVVGKLDRGDHFIEKIIFESQPHFYVTANLYLPKGGAPPYPAVLYPLGHELGAKAHNTWQQMLGSLAKKGYAALAWDSLGQGERVQLYDPDFKDSKVFRSTTEHTMVGIQCLLTGDNVARYTIWDGMRALDYLLSRKEVDASRIACTGNSGGGTHTAYLSALDDRIAVAAPSCYLTSWRNLLDTIGPQDAEQVLLPWLLDGLDHPDFIHAFAPKPYLILSAIRDFFAIEGARSTFEEARRIYALLGESSKLKMVEADDGHGYSKPRRLAAYDWFARWLKHSDDREPEPEVEILAEQELFCTETGQVATALGGETVFSLNLRRAERLDPKLPPLRAPADLEGYRREIRRRVSELAQLKPAGSAVKAQVYGQLQRTGYHIEKLMYESEPGISIPSLLFVPDSPSGRKPGIIYVNGRGKSARASSGGDIEQLAHAGHVVLAVDPRGIGETFFTDEDQSNDFPRYFGDYNSAMTALLVGKPLAGMRALDIARGIDLLSSRPEVDPEKISAMGVGTGGIPLLFAAALDERIRKIALENTLVSYGSVVRQRIHRQVFENVITGVLKSFDLPQVVASLAPRRVWIVDASDPLGMRLRAPEVEREYAASIQSYGLAGDALALKIASRRPEEKAASFYAGFLKE